MGSSINKKKYTYDFSYSTAMYTLVCIYRYVYKLSKGEVVKLVAKPVALIPWFSYVAPNLIKLILGPRVWLLCDELHGTGTLVYNSVYFFLNIY